MKMHRIPVRKKYVLVNYITKVLTESKFAANFTASIRTKILKGGASTSNITNKARAYETSCAFLRKPLQYTLLHLYRATYRF